jgi:hypothetical protein
VNHHLLNRILFSSERHDWETPDELFAALNAEFGFEIDVCASSESAKCPHFFSPDQDACLTELGAFSSL